MIVQFLDGKFRTIDNSGFPAVGWKVWAYASPDTSTPAPTYSDAEATVLNPWPIVLDARGECFIYIRTATDFYLCTPTATNISAPIWTSRKVGEQGSESVSGFATPITLNNNYIVDITPYLSVLRANLVLIMVPDVSNSGTITSTVFTGNGINDLVPSGAYIGAAVAIFTFTIDGTVEAVPIAPTAVLSGTAGVIDVGNHYFKMTAVTAAGETPPGDVSALVVGNGSKGADISNIPAIAGQVTGYNIYMNPATGAIGTYYLVNATPITTDTYFANIADATLITHAEAPTVNTTGNKGVAPTAVLSAVAGAVTAGDHYVKMTAITDAGESSPGNVSALVVADGSHRIDVSGIPVLAGSVTGYNLYMNEAGGTVYYLVNATPITTTTYALNIDDATLITNAVAPADSTASGSTDTFKWQKDGGDWHLLVPIDPNNPLIYEGVAFPFASLTGHTYGDTWAVTVQTPATIDLDGFGALIVYKNKGAQIVPLDGGDMQAGYAGEFILNDGMSAWLLTNPASPVVSSPTISATRYRNNITANYSMVIADQGKEISCIGTFTIKLLKCPDFAHKFVYIRNTGNGAITIDAQGYLIKGYGSVVGRTTFTLARIVECVQLATDGIDWHILSIVVSPVLAGSGDSAGPTGGLDIYSTPGVYYWTCPAGITSVNLTAIGGGGGGNVGAYDGSDPTQYGYAGITGITDSQPGVVVVPGTVYTVTVGAGGHGATYRPGPSLAAAGSVSTFVDPGGPTTKASGAGGAAGSATATTNIADTVPTGNGGRGGGYYDGGGNNGSDGGPGSVSIAY